jgi:nucleoside-diphosphate-sugar epimerase
MRVAVTGGSGRAGQAVVRDLLEHDYDVLNLDVVPSPLSRYLLGYAPEFSWRGLF